MSNTTASLRRKIGGAGELQSVVRTMKAVAASRIQSASTKLAISSAESGFRGAIARGWGAEARQHSLARRPATSPLASAPLQSKRAGRTQSL